MLSQIVSVLSSFPTQCASMKLLTILWSCVVNVAVQLLVLILACKQLVSNHHSKQQVLIQISISKYIWLLMWLYVFVKQVSCGKGHFTEFALVSERARKMDVFYVHPQIAPGWSSFATNGTTVRICSHLWIGHNILIQHLVTTCNSRTRSITFEMRPSTFCTPSSRGCSV